MHLSRPESSPFLLVTGMDVPSYGGTNFAYALHSMLDHVYLSKILFDWIVLRGLARS